MKPASPHFQCHLKPSLRCLILGLCVLVGVSTASAQVAAELTSSLKKLSLQELMDLDVTSVSRRPEKLMDSASAIQVVTGKDIQRSGATNIPEALRLATNLQVAQKGSHSWGISARGFNTELANKLLVLVDGRTVYTPLFSGVFWDRQDYLLEDLDRIEVISGPGGTLWGANAVNGVINITTKSARDTQGGYLEAGGGTTLRRFVAARYGGVLAPNVYFRIYGKYFDRAAAVLANGANASDAWDMSQGGFRIDAELSSSDRVTLQSDLFGSDQFPAMRGSGIVSGGNVLGRWSHVFADNSELTVQAYYDRTHMTMLVPPYVINGLTLAPAGQFRDDLDTYDLDVQHRLEIGRGHQLVWGFGYRHTRDVTGNAPALAFLPSILQQDLYSGFVQDEIKLAENLAVTLGAKLEQNDYTGSEMEPSVRAQWNVHASHTLWGAISRAVRMPSRIDRDFSQPAPPALVVLAGGSDFESETVLAYEAGYRTQLGTRVIAAASAFYNDYDDLRSTSFTPDTIVPFFFENHLAGESYGTELSATVQVSDSWRLQLGYNWLKTRLRVRPGEFDFNNALNETADPEHQFSLRSSWNVGARVEIDAGLRWVDTLTINSGGSPATVPSYSELDLRLGWRATESVEFSVVGLSLLHDQHIEYGAPGPARAEIERSIHGKVAWRF